MEVKEIVSQLTKEEKASLLSGKTVWESVNIDRVGIPSLFFSDGPHGLRKQKGASDHLGLNESVPATCFPTAATLANSWDKAICYQVGEAIAKESQQQDVHVLLGPGINMKRHPLCGRNFEYYSEDPYHTGKLSAQFIQGVQSVGVAACPKHFAANSQELRRMSSDSIVDERTFREIYTTAFEIAIKEGQAKTIMSAYNKINGVYAHENEYLLRQLLVDEWGFKGIVVSDWGGSNDHIEGIKNGGHLAMPSIGKTGQRDILEALENGQLDEAVLNERVSELLTIVFDLATKPQTQDVDVAKHHELARFAASQSIVLLKNEQSILPLPPQTKIAVIGDFAQKPRFQGSGSSMVNPTKTDALLDLVSEYPVDVVGFAKGFQRHGQTDEALAQEAVTLAQQAEVIVLYIGLDEMSESEGLDRIRFELPQNQLDLIAKLATVNKPIVAVLTGGSPIQMDWQQHVQGIVHGYLTGQAGAGAILDVLTGVVNPSGRLSETYPVSLADVPSQADYPSQGQYALYKEGQYIGYRYFDTTQTPVAFPFGYGLSYTTFETSAHQVLDNGVQVTVKNTGSVAGATVIQLYVAKQNSAVYRPAKELKGFEKVFLQPGEETTVVIPFDAYTFRVYDVQTKQFVVESGEYQLFIGDNVSSIQWTGTVSREGVTLQAQPVSECYRTGQVLSVTNADFETILYAPVPTEQIGERRELVANDALSQMQYAKSWLARFAYRQMTNMLNKSFEKGKPDLNILFTYNMPFRAIGKMTNGVVDRHMVDGMLTVVNGHFFKGIAQIVKAYFANRKYHKTTN